MLSQFIENNRRIEKTPVMRSNFTFILLGWLYIVSFSQNPTFHAVYDFGSGDCGSSIQVDVDGNILLHGATPYTGYLSKISPTGELLSFKDGDTAKYGYLQGPNFLNNSWWFMGVYSNHINYCCPPIPTKRYLLQFDTSLTLLTAQEIPDSIDGAMFFVGDKILECQIPLDTGESACFKLRDYSLGQLWCYRDSSIHGVGVRKCTTNPSGGYTIMTQPFSVDVQPWILTLTAGGQLDTLIELNHRFSPDGIFMGNNWFTTGFVLDSMGFGNYSTYIYKLNFPGCWVVDSQFIAAGGFASNLCFSNSNQLIYFSHCDYSNSKIYGYDLNLTPLYHYDIQSQSYYFETLEDVRQIFVEPGGQVLVTGSVNMPDPCCLMSMTTFLLKLNPDLTLTGPTIDTLPKPALIAYPNPITQNDGALTAVVDQQLIGANPLLLQLSDITGMPVLSIPVTGTTLSIDITSLPNGVYSLNLFSGNYLIQNRVIFKI